KLLPLASRVYLVAPSNRLGDGQLAAEAQRCQALLGQAARLGMIALASDDSPPRVVREQVQTALGLPTCEVLPSQASLLGEAARVEPPMTLCALWLGVSKLITRLARALDGLRDGLSLGSWDSKGIAPGF